MEASKGRRFPRELHCGVGRLPPSLNLSMAAPGDVQPRQRVGRRTARFDGPCRPVKSRVRRGLTQKGLQRVNDRTNDVGADGQPSVARCGLDDRVYASRAGSREGAMMHSMMLVGVVLHVTLFLVLAFFVLFAAQKAEGLVKLLGNVVGVWLLILAILVIIGCVTAPMFGGR